VLRDPSVSKLHAHFARRGAAWQLIDRGSANGTSMNGRKLDAGAPVYIEPGAKIVFGAVECIVADGELLYRELGPGSDFDDG
jgi:pSer/pThr/pTyr-binding forkhead associated (FHA) protein